MLICAWIAISGGTAFAQGWQHIGNANRVEKLPDGVELSSGQARVRAVSYTHLIRPSLRRVSIFLRTRFGFASSNFIARAAARRSKLSICRRGIRLRTILSWI